MIFKFVLFRSLSSLGWLLEAILAHFGKVLVTRIGVKVAQKVTRNRTENYTKNVSIFGPKMESKTAPRGPKMAPRRPQDDPEWAQDGPKTTQDGPEKAQDSPKTTKDGPKTAQDSSKTAQDGPKTSQDGPETARRRPKTVPRRPKTAPRRPMTAPRLPQDCLKTASRRPKTAPSPTFPFVFVAFLSLLRVIVSFLRRRLFHGNCFTLYLHMIHIKSSTCLVMSFFFVQEPSRARPLLWSSCPPPRQARSQAKPGACLGVLRPPIVCLS